MELNPITLDEKEWAPEEELKIINHLLGKLNTRIEHIAGQLIWKNQDELDHAVHHLEVGLANITNLREQLDFAAKELKDKVDC